MNLRTRLYSFLRWANITIGCLELLIGLACLQPGCIVQGILLILFGVFVVPWLEKL